MSVPSPSTLLDLIEGCRDVAPARGMRIVSPRFEETVIPYRELYRRVLFHADALRAQGIEPGQHVVLPLSTEPDLVCSFFALLWMGAVPVSVGGQMAGQERGAYWRRVADLMKVCRLDRIVLTPAATEEVRGTGAVDPWLLASASVAHLDPDATPPDVPRAAVSPDDVAFIQFSSGSTAEPKGVEITHRNACANLGYIVSVDGRTERSCTVSWVPLYHDMGLIGGLLSPLLLHDQLVLLHPVCFLMKPLSWLDHISRYGGTVTPVPNFALEMCTKRIRQSQLDQHQPDLSSLEYVWNGSEPVSADTVEQFYERFAPYGLRRGTVQPAYGMAEATLAVAASPAGTDLVVRTVDGREAVSVGRPVGDFVVRIVDRQGRPVPPEQVGEIVVSGSCVSPGYYRNEAATRERHRGGWLHTDDLGFLDPEGRLFVTGRLRDLIIVGGRNYYGDEVAARLSALPFLRQGQSHVFSVNVGSGEQVIVMTVLEGRSAKAVEDGVKAFREFLAGEAGSWLAQRFADRATSYIRDAIPSDVELIQDGIKHFLLREFGLPVDDVIIVPRVPRTSSGKIRRGECERMYREHRGREPEGE